MRSVVLFFALFSGVLYTQAQEFGNANLRLGLYGQEQVRCFVKADSELLSEFLTNHNGVYFSKFRGWTKVELRGQDIKELSKQKWCTSVRIEGDAGQTLTDTNLINTKTHFVHQGKIEGYPGYSGTGVVMGFVDTGIDFTHPDFQNKDGSTRIVKIWDQKANSDTTLRPSYGYGEVYDSSMINAGTCPHIDNNGHGTQVTGIGAGNGFSVPDSIANYAGHAPNSTIFCVNTDFNRANWTLSVAESVEWIFSEADKLGLPCVINLSIGTYGGSHDGRDIVAQLIDSMIAAKPGRMVVCAAGNAGSIGPFHLRTEVNSDTAFTYFNPNPNSRFGNAIFIELWGDTADLKNLHLGFGYTDTTTWTDTLFYNDPAYQRLDTLMQTSLGGNSQLTTYAEVQGANILYQVLCINPNPNHLYGLWTQGTGNHDVWATRLLGWADIVRTGLPTNSVYPLISKYVYPDSTQSIVSSWNCSPNVISVGNYNNRFGYLNQYDSLRITVDFPVGGKGASSSIGPNRLNYTKPDIMAPGNFTVAAARFQDINALKTIPSIGYRLAKGGYHFANGGTSMASPAVAGIAALYLEKCPTAPASEVKNALLSNSFSDPHTGVVPNIVFGAGKVDAFATLSSSNLNDSIVSSSNFLLCQGDSIELKPSITYNKYLWSDGETQVPRYVSNVDTLQLTYFSSSGCNGKSDTIITELVPNPKVSIISETDSFCIGSELILSGIGAKKYTWSTNQIADSIVISQQGTYYVKGVDANNCSGYDTLEVRQYLCGIIGGSEQTIPTFKVFPNPVTNYLELSWNGNETQVIVLAWFDMNGKPIDVPHVKSGTRANGVLQINTEQLAKGTYFLNIVTSNSNQFVRVVKE